MYFHDIKEIFRLDQNLDPNFGDQIIEKSESNVGFDSPLNHTYEFAQSPLINLVFFSYTKT